MTTTALVILAGVVLVSALTISPRLRDIATQLRRIADHTDRIGDPEHPDLQMRRRGGPQW